MNRSLKRFLRTVGGAALGAAVTAALAAQSDLKFESQWATLLVVLIGGVATTLDMKFREWGWY